MTKNKLDQLFEKRLKELDVEPSVRAFEKFEQQLDGKRGRPIWFYIAAAISLLFIVSGVYWTNMNSHLEVATLDTVEINPVEEETVSEPIVSQKNPPVAIEVNPNQKLVKVDSKPVEKINHKDAQNIAEIEDNTLATVEKTVTVDEVIEVTEEEPAIDLNSEVTTQASLADTDQKEAVEEKVERSLPKVKITYISGRKKKNALLAKSQVQPDTSQVKDGALNKIWNSARNLANGNLIADLRDVKENFFNKNDD